MQVPTVGSYVKIVIHNKQAAFMIPPQPTEKVYEGTVLDSYKWLNDKEFCLSGDKNWPIRVIHMDRVSKIDLIKGKFKTVSTENKVFVINGSKGNKYHVTRNGNKYTCTCTGFQFRKQCKHISEVSQK